MLSITSTLAALCALLLVGLSIAVSLARMKARVKIGNGEDDRLLRHIRARGNFVEYVPLALILCGLAEYRATPTGYLLLAAALLFAGRIMHAAAMLFELGPLRPVAMVATYTSLLPALLVRCFCHCRDCRRSREAALAVPAIPCRRASGSGLAHS